jgi:hypothetical protein
MCDENGLTPAERELETALRGLRPAAPRLDRDRLMFEAGQASVRPPAPRLWQGVAAGFALAFVVALAWRPPVRAVERVVYVPQGAGAARRMAPAVDDGQTTASAERLRREGASYVRLRDRVLIVGLDALPEPSPWPAERADAAIRVRRLIEPQRPESTPWEQLREFFAPGDAL